MFFSGVFIGGPRSTPSRSGGPHPDWLGKEPFIILGNWGMPIFRRRAGGQSVDMEADYAKQHTEEAVVTLGISGRNTVWEQGADYPRFLSHMDIVRTEEGNQARVNAAGILISKIRTDKMAEQLRNRIFTYTGGTHGNKLQMAEAMAQTGVARHRDPRTI